MVNKFDVAATLFKLLVEAVDDELNPVLSELAHCKVAMQLAAGPDRSS